MGGHQGTTDDFAAIPFRLVLFSTAHLHLAVNSCPLFDIVFPPLLQSAFSSFTFHCTLYVYLKLLNQKILRHGQTICSIRLSTRVRSSSYSLMAAWIFLRTPSLVTWSLYKMLKCMIQNHFCNSFLIGQSFSLPKQPQNSGPII